MKLEYNSGILIYACLEYSVAVRLMLIVESVPLSFVYLLANADDYHVQLPHFSCFSLESCKEQSIQIEYYACYESRDKNG